jgi:hypothetical protein
MDYNEVARQLEVPVGTVRSRLCRAREHLKQLIELENKNKGDSDDEEIAAVKAALKPRSRGARALSDAPKRTGTRG